MRSSLGLPLFWRVCLINGALFAAAAAVLVVSPATVSPQPTVREVLVLAGGLVLMAAANALLLRGVLAPLDRLVDQIDRFDTAAPGGRLPAGGDVMTTSVATSFNALLARLERERAESNARALTAQEGERRRIAQELHDEVGQSLTVVLLSTKRALDLAPAEIAQELTLVQDSARASLEEVGRIVQGLRPGVLEDLGLATALSAMVKDVAAHSPVRVRHELDGSDLRLEPHVELVLFRVAQEALTNVTRHASATTAQLRLAADAGDVVLSVRDDGRGVGSTAEGEGIRGMRERALAVGGELRIQGVDGGGTEVSLRIPMTRGAEG